MGRALHVPLLVGVACLLASPVSSAEPAGAKGWMLSFEGFGPVRVGMTVREAERASKVKLDEERTELGAADVCHYASNQVVLPGVAFMLEKGKIVRIDVFFGAYRTAAGVRIGMTEQEVRTRHPGIEDGPHRDVPSGHHFTVVSEGGRHAIVFETDGRVVTKFRAGERGAAAYGEGCQ